MPRPSRILIALTLFFAAGALIAGLTSFALLFPKIGLEPLWRLNPQAQSAFRSMGLWAIVINVDG